MFISVRSSWKEVPLPPLPPPTPHLTRVATVPSPGYVPIFPCNLLAAFFQKHFSSDTHEITSASGKSFGLVDTGEREFSWAGVNPLNAELNPISYLLALLGAHHFLHVSRKRVKSLTLRLLMSHTHTHTHIYIYIYIYI